MNPDSYLTQLVQAIEATPRQPILELTRRLVEARDTGRRVFIFGNGGSAATASHMAADLLKGMPDAAGPRLRIISLADHSASLTAYANDLGYDTVFAGPLAALAEPGDVALAISGSGNSPNVLRAMQVANNMGLVRLGLTGRGGGALQPMCEVCLVVPSDSMQVIEDVHHAALHAIFLELEGGG